MPGPAEITLTTPLTKVPGIGPKAAAALATMGLTNAGRLIAHLPIRHERLEAESTVSDIAPDQLISARGEITATRIVPRGRRPRFEAVLLDDTARLDLVWFGGLYLKDRIKPGHRLRIQGKARRFGPGIQVANPTFEILTDDAEPEPREARIRPVYPASELVTSKKVEQAVSKVLPAILPQIFDHLPASFRAARDMPDLASAYRAMHAPQSQAEADAARRRLAYDELLLLQLGIHMKRAHLRLGLRAPALRCTPAIDRHIRARLPFTLTPAQDRVVAEIARDLSSATPTNRLIQGDVGSGKTVVALYAMLMAVGSEAIPRGIGVPADAAATGRPGRPEIHPRGMSASSPVQRRSGANLPHWRQDGATYAVTFRLADSLPADVLKQWRAEREHIVRRAAQTDRPLMSHELARLDDLHSARIEQWLDKGVGSCSLREPAIARLVHDTIFHFDGERYDVIAWCVMPNHVHVVVRVHPGRDLSSVLHTWKSFTAKGALGLLARSEPGAFWQSESFDHLIRDQQDLNHHLQYVLGNPTAAGLINWPWVGTGRAEESTDLCEPTPAQTASAGTPMPRLSHQAALMAPTELLAEQHFASISRMLEGSRVRVELLTGGTPRAERDSILARLASGGIDILIGTHALLTEGVNFRSLAVVIVDEQHRFGVHHRALLRTKGATDSASTPHMLVMTATPIPRTLAITLFGDLDISTIDALPPGRIPVRTAVVRPAERPAVYHEVRAALDRGEQAFIVAPAIDESEGEIESVRALLRRLEEGELAGKRLAAIHGRLKRATRDHIMERFRAGLIDALVATTVIEVGVDVPNASVMVVEGADRFGLAQLHQLRGRIGRGRAASRCILVADPITPDAADRLAAIAATTDGFALAEKDMELRGPGELFGTRQAGIAPFKVADLARDLPLLGMARRDAAEWIAASPTLSAPGEALLLRRLLKAHGESLGLGDVG